MVDWIVLKTSGCSQIHHCTAGCQVVIVVFGFSTDGCYANANVSHN